MPEHVVYGSKIYDSIATCAVNKGSGYGYDDHTIVTIPCKAVCKTHHYGGDAPCKNSIHAVATKSKSAPVCTTADDGRR